MLIEQTKGYGEVSLVDAAASFDPETGKSSVFLVNRSKTKTVSLAIDLGGLGDVSIVSAQSLFDQDITAANTLEQPERVSMKDNASAKLVDGVMHIELPPVSWSAVELG